MNFDTDFELVLIAWLDKHGRSNVSVDRDTPLLEDGVLDSIMFTDLLLFVESMLERPLVVADLEPASLRSVATITAHFTEAAA